MSKYYEQASNQLKPSHNNQITNLNNQLAQNQANLESQKGGINSNYDTQVGNQNLNNKKAKNNMSNSMLGRGLGASSIAVSGLAESDQINNRMVGDINNRRTMDLNNIDEQKKLLAQNNNNLIAQMDNDLEKQILALAYQLEDRDFDKNFKNQQLAQQKELQMAQLAWQRENAGNQMALQREQMEWQRQQAANKEKAAKDNQYNSLYDNLMASYADIMNNPKMTDEQKYKSTKSLYSQADSYGNRYGFDFNDYKNMIYNSGNTYDSMNKKYKY